MAVLRIETYVDKNGEIQVRKLRDEVSKLDGSAKKADASMLGLAKRAAAAYISFQALKIAFNETVVAGLKFNSQIETMQIGIASLISVNAQNITQQGKALTQQEKFNMAMVSSAETISMLKAANLETSATLKQLTEGFQATAGPALKAGFSIQQTVEYTKLMTQAAGAMGVPMEQLAQEMRSVVSGTIDANSVVAKNIGITNEQIKAAKEAGNLYEFLNEKLGGFAEAGKVVSESWDGSVSNMEDAWDSLTGAITQPIFDGLKDDIQDLAVYFNEASKSVKEFFDTFKRVDELNGLEELNKRAIDLYDELEAAQKDVADGMWYNSDARDVQAEKRVRVIKQQINQLEAAYTELNAAMSDSLSLGAGDEGETDQARKAREKYMSTQLDRELKLYQDYYKEVGNAEMSWLLSEDRLDAYQTALTLGMDQAATERYVKQQYAAYAKAMSDVREKSVEDDLLFFVGPDAGEKVKATFHSWADTLNSSVTDSLVDAVQSGDVMGAFSALGAETGTAMLKASVGNLMAGGDQLAAAGGANSMGGWWGIAAGIGISAAASYFMNGSDRKSTTEVLLENIKSELEKQTARLDAQIGLYASTGLLGSQKISELDKTLSTGGADSASFNIDNLYKATLRSVSADVSGNQDIYALGERFGIDVSKYITAMSDPSYSYDTESHADALNAVVSGLNQDILQTASSLDVLSYALESGEISLTTYSDLMEDIVAQNSDLASSILDVSSTIGTLSADLNGIYEDITGTDITGSSALSRAYADLEDIGWSAENYTANLKGLIEGLDEMDASIASLTGDLTGSDAARQNSAIAVLSELTGAFFESNESALNYIDSIELVGKSMADASISASDALRNIDAAYLGEYSPLSLMQKADYASMVANNALSYGGQSAIDASYSALQAVAASATRDEQLIPAFERYIKLQEEQVQDSTRSDIVAAIYETNKVLTKKIEDLEAQYEQLVEATYATASA